MAMWMAPSASPARMSARWAAGVLPMLIRGMLGLDVDPASGVAFAYLTNRPGKRFENERADALITSVYAAFGDTR